MGVIAPMITAVPILYHILDALAENITSQLFSLWLKWFFVHPRDCLQWGEGMVESEGGGSSVFKSS